MIHPSHNNSSSSDQTSFPFPIAMGCGEANSDRGAGGVIVSVTGVPGKTGFRDKICETAASIWNFQQ